MTCMVFSSNDEDLMIIVVIANNLYYDYIFLFIYVCVESSKRPPDG